MIVTGGPDNIRIWSVQSGHALQRILLGGKDTIVWCLAVTRSVLICMCMCVHVRERESVCVSVWDLNHQAKGNAAQADCSE